MTQDHDIICCLGEAMTVIQNVTSCFQVAKTTGKREGELLLMNLRLNSLVRALGSAVLFQSSMMSEGR